MTGSYERFGGCRERERPQEEEETLEAPERCVATRRKADGALIHFRGGYVVVPYPYLMPFGGDAGGTMLLLKTGQRISRSRDPGWSSWPACCATGG